MNKFPRYFILCIMLGTPVIFPGVCRSQEHDLAGAISKLEAPVLGITATSVILTWDDHSQPDWGPDGPGQEPKTYFVYRDGTKIGSTTKKTFTATGLEPAKNYTFSVSPDHDGKNKDLNTVQITTKSRGKVLDVKKFGAKGDGKQIDTEAIQKSINNCPAGGTVFVPAGNYLVGHLELKSDMTLELAKDAVLSFIGYNQGDVYPVTKAVLSGPDGDIEYKSISLISGVGIRHVSITGEGIIDGNGETWWPHYKEITRPFTVEFINSSDILVQGVTMQDPPFWNNHLVYVDRAVYSDVKFLKVSTVDGVNGDGLNPDASRDILVAGCLFGNQDDAIAIKSGKYVEDGNKRRRSSEQITIRDCVFDGNAAPGSDPLGIAIGSESSGGVKHIVVRDCSFIDAASLANIKTNRTRLFARVEDVRFENITYTNTRHVDRWWNRAPLSIDLFYGVPEGTDPSVAEPFSEQTPVFRDIRFKNISISNPVGKGIYVSGLAESPVRDLIFDQVYVRSKDGVIVRNVDALSVTGISVSPLQENKNH